MRDKALYTFHKATQWDNIIVGVVADNIIEAIEYYEKHEGNRLKVDDCVNYTLVQDQVEDGIHFYIEIENESYEG